MAPVKGDDVTGEKSSHQRGYSGRAASEEKMGVVGDKGPCVADSLCLRKEERQPINQVVPVVVIREDLPSFNSTNHHVVQDTGCIETGLPRSVLMSVLHILNKRRDKQSLESVFKEILDQIARNTEVDLIPLVLRPLPDLP